MSQECVGKQKLLSALLFHLSFKILFLKQHWPSASCSRRPWCRLPLAAARAALEPQRGSPSRAAGSGPCHPLGRVSYRGAAKSMLKRVPLCFHVCGRQRPRDSVPEGLFQVLRGCSADYRLFCPSLFPPSVLSIPAPTRLPLAHPPCSREKNVACSSGRRCRGVGSCQLTRGSQPTEPPFYAASASKERPRKQTDRQKDVTRAELWSHGSQSCSRGRS